MSSAARVTRPPAPVAPLPAAVTALPVRRFTLGEYHQLLDIGILNDRDPYELLNGVITPKMPQNTPHAGSSAKLEKRLWRLLPDEWLLRTQKPLSIPGSESEPEPDLLICRGPETRYDGRHPRPKDVAVVVEVADRSVPLDTGEKLRTYAAARIPEYWVVNIPDRRVEVYTRPRGGKNPAYRSHVVYAPGDVVPVVVGGAELGAVAVADLLP